MRPTTQLGSRGMGQRAGSPRASRFAKDVESEDNYSRSRSIFVRATRDEEDGTVQISYLYENTTSMPKQTDSSTHNGAARLNVIARGGRVWMEGTYWTDRNWQNGLNTAGRSPFDETEPGDVDYALDGGDRGNPD